MIVLTKKIPTISRQLGMQPHSWLGHEVDSRAILLIVATATTSSSQPSGPSKPLGFTNNSGGGRAPYTETPHFLSIQHADSVKPPCPQEKSHKLICFQAGKVGHLIPPGLLTPGQATVTLVRSESSAKPSLPPATNKKSTTEAPPLVPRLNRRTDRILKNRGTIPPYLALVDLHYTVMSSFVLF